jgi:hypothetical protein
MASGRRFLSNRNAVRPTRPALQTIEPAEIGRLAQEFAELGGDPAMLRFNEGGVQASMTRKISFWSAVT